MIRLKPSFHGNHAFHRSHYPKAKQTLKENYWGFLMLGGMSGADGDVCGSAYLSRRPSKYCCGFSGKQKRNGRISSLAMNPVVYNFALIIKAPQRIFFMTIPALMPQKYYALVFPGCRLHSSDVPDSRKIEIDLSLLKTAHQDEAYPISAQS